MLAALLLGAPLLHAQVEKEKGSGDIAYGTFGKKASDERAAQNEARKNAMKRYASKQNAAWQQSYAGHESAIIEKLDTYVPEYVVLVENVDKSSRRYSVTVEASIDRGALDRLFGSLKASKEYFAFVFVAREQKSRTTFDPSNEAIADKRTFSQANEDVNLAEDGSGAGRTAETHDRIRVQSSGSSTVSTTDRAYRAFTTTQVDAAVNSVLTPAGLEAVAGGDAGLDVDALLEDFGTGNDVSAANRRAAIATCRENEIRYLAFATMDVGIPSKNPNTGKDSVHVTVTAEVIDMSKKFPTKVAAVTGVPYQGDGPDSDVARTNALNTAAVETARVLLDQLRAKASP
jgi:hypothetical protein